MNKEKMKAIKEDTIEELFHVSGSKEREKCPHCGNRITPQVALLALRSQGFRKHFKVRFKANPEITMIVDESEINPLTQEIME